MTVCIAAISRVRGVIIAASDMMLSDDVSSADDAAYKISALFKGHRRWWCMYAGYPTDFEELRNSLSEVEQPKTLADAIAATELAYDKLTKHYIERYILAPFGLTHEAFMRDGPAIFGETYFRELADQCILFKPAMETSLLVFGFDSIGIPHLFQAQRTVKAEVHDTLGFHAIGTGAWSAQGSLFAGGLSSAGTENEAIYRVCEAKFVSEVARSVGTKTTVLHVYSSGGSESVLYIDDDSPIKAAWKRQRNMKPPARAINEIERLRSESDAKRQQ
jgi:hypothetical protein